MRGVVSGGLATIVGGGVAAAELGISNPQDSYQLDRKSLEDRGFADLVEVYEEQTRLLDTFGWAGPYQVSIQESDEINDGWGEKNPMHVSAAEDHAKSLPVTKIPTGEYELECRNLLLSIARSAPALILALPPGTQFEFQSSAGKFIGSKPPIIKLTSPSDNTYALVTALHEFEHNMQVNWRYAKPYVNKADFLTYATSYKQSIFDVLHMYGSHSLAEWMTAQNGMPLLSINEENSTTISKLVNVLEQDYVPEDIIDLRAQTQPVESELMALIYRYNRLAYFVALIQCESDRKIFQGGTLTEKEYSIVNTEYNSDVSRFKREMAKEIAHYLCGPVQQVDGGLPDVNDRRPSGYLNMVNEKLQLLRYKAFSPYVTINSSPEDISRLFKSSLHPNG